CMLPLSGRSPGVLEPHVDRTPHCPSRLMRIPAPAFTLALNVARLEHRRGQDGLHMQRLPAAVAEAVHGAGWDEHGRAGSEHGALVADPDLRLPGQDAQHLLD